MNTLERRKDENLILRRFSSEKEFFEYSEQLSDADLEVRKEECRNFVSKCPESKWDCDKISRKTIFIANCINYLVRSAKDDFSLPLEDRAKYRNKFSGIYDVMLAEKG